jgi:hypothetical protein
MVSGSMEFTEGHGLDMGCHHYGLGVIRTPPRIQIGSVSFAGVFIPFRKGSVLYSQVSSAAHDGKHRNKDSRSSLEHR